MGIATAVNAIKTAKIEINLFFGALTTLGYLQDLEETYEVKVSRKDRFAENGLGLLEYVLASLTGYHIREIKPKDPRMNRRKREIKPTMSK